MTSGRCLGRALVQGRLFREDEIKFFLIMEQRELTVSELTRELVSIGLKSVASEV